MARPRSVVVDLEPLMSILESAQGDGVSKVSIEISFSDEEEQEVVTIGAWSEVDNEVVEYGELDAQSYKK